MQMTLEEAPASAVSPATIELLLFRLGGDRKGERSELFAINVVNVREIVAMPSVTAIAGALPHVLGVVNLRGDIVRVVDLPSLAGCVPATGFNIMLVTDIGATAQAFAVESVEEIVVIGSHDLVADAYPAGCGMVSAVARIDAGKRLAQVLDVASVLRSLTM